MEVNFEHIMMACDWAESDSTTIGGVQRQYDQREWDSGKTCCIWGAAHLLATGEPATSGPPPKWAARSIEHAMVAEVMWESSARPEDVRAALRGEILNDASSDVRWAIAKIPTLPEALVERLAGDSNPEVRVTVAERATLPDALVERLANDESYYVRWTVARRPTLPDALEADDEAVACESVQR